MFTPFYNRIIRKMVVAFGTLFNDISLIRYNNDMSTQFERIKVPISYGPKEKFITRINSDPDLTKSIAIGIPRMSFELTGINYDSARKQVTTLKSFGTSSTTGQVRTQNIGVPYDFNFTLSIYVRNVEDGTQIVEQILPYFTPDYIMTLNLVDGVPETSKDVPFILNSIDTMVDYEGDFTTTRLIVWTLDFTAKGFFFGPIADSKIIMNTGGFQYGGNTEFGGVIINFYNEISNRQLQEVVLGSGYGNFKENEVVRVIEKNNIGKIFNWNSNTKTLMVNDLTEVLLVGDVVRGDESNAYYTVSQLKDTYVKLARVQTVQNPLSANISSDFGFTTTIDEFPVNSSSVSEQTPMILNIEVP